MEIRKARANELPKVAEIFMSGTSDKPYNEKWTKKTALIKIKDHIKNKNKVYVAIVNGNIVGFITTRLEYLYDGNKLFIEEFYIKKEYQNQGIGASMINKLEEIYKGKIKSIALMSSKKSPAFKFYLRKGFKPYHDVIFMKKRVSC